MPSTPQQIRRRDQLEGVLRLAAPFLDAVLAAGERVSRIVDPSDDGSHAIRPPAERMRLSELRPISKPPKRAED